MSNIITSDVPDVVLDPKSLIDTEDTYNEKAKRTAALKELDDLLEESEKSITQSLQTKSLVEDGIRYTLQLKATQTNAKFSMNCHIVNIQSNNLDSESDTLEINVSADSPVKLLKLLTFFIDQKHGSEQKRKRRLQLWKELFAAKGTRPRRRKKLKRNDVVILGLYGRTQFNNIQVNLISENKFMYRIKAMNYRIENNRPICNLMCVRIY